MNTSHRPATARGIILAAVSCAALAAGSVSLTMATDGAPSPSPLAVLPSASAAAPVASPGDACARAAPGASLLPSPAPDSLASPGDVISLDASPTPDLSTPEPVSGGGDAHGDVPDNAVFLTYQDAAHGFSIQYVEGWQVTPGPDGVVIRDKDSSETVAVVPLPADITTCVVGSDLPALQAADGFSLISQDLVKVHGRRIVHLAYHLPAPPDPVTGKRVPSTVDRYYVPGPDFMAIVSLSTPDGVDNVDAFRQMIRSLTWS